MPCQSEYLEATGGERELSRVVMLLTEIQSGTPPLEQPDGAREWKGYHPAAYSCFVQSDLDAKTRQLCHRLTAMSADEISMYSLELQIWWRDHQRADADRHAREAKRAADDQAKERAELDRLRAKYEESK